MAPSVEERGGPRRGASGHGAGGQAVDGVVTEQRVQINRDAGHAAAAHGGGQVRGWGGQGTCGRHRTEKAEKSQCPWRWPQCPWWACMRSGSVRRRSAAGSASVPPRSRPVAPPSTTAQLNRDPAHVAGVPLHHVLLVVGTRQSRRSFSACRRRCPGPWGRPTASAGSCGGHKSPPAAPGQARPGTPPRCAAEQARPQRIEQVGPGEERRATRIFMLPVPFSCPNSSLPAELSRRSPYTLLHTSPHGSRRGSASFPCMRRRDPWP